MPLLMDTKMFLQFGFIFSYFIILGLQYQSFSRSKRLSELHVISLVTRLTLLLCNYYVTERLDGRYYHKLFIYLGTNFNFLSSDTQTLKKCIVLVTERMQKEFKWGHISDIGLIRSSSIIAESLAKNKLTGSLT